jgi:hypothetical protein
MSGGNFKGTAADAKVLKEEQQLDVEEGSVAVERG